MTERATWPPEDIRRIVDALGDGLLIATSTGQILYVNPAGEKLLGWTDGDLVGQSAGRLLEAGYPSWAEQLGAFTDGDPSGWGGKRLDASLTMANGHVVRVDLVLSIGTTRTGHQVVIAVLRSRDGHQLQRLSAFTQSLLDVLTTASSAGPSEQLLGALGSRLDWDVAALWGLEPDGSLICRGVWTAPEAPAAAFIDEKRRDPTRDSGGLARLVMEEGEPRWFTDISSDERFTSQAIRADGLTSACAFPIHYGGSRVGVIKLMSRERRDSDPDLVELIAAVGGYLGEILHALEQTVEREGLLAELETTQRRLQFLLRANRVVSNATGYVQTLERLAGVAVPTLGDLCLIDVIDESGLIHRLASRHAEPDKQHLADELLNRYAPDPRSDHPSADVMATGKSRWSAEMSDEFLRATSHDDRHFAILKELSFTSYMTVPLLVNDRARGTVTLVSAGSGRRYSTRELEGAEELAMQIAGVVERARMLDREHHISHILQQNLLPDRLPDIGGLLLAARYVPGTTDAEVGGDWYEVVPLEGGAAALVVGDVQGHDMEAASIMGQVRPALSMALSEGSPPGTALHRVNQFLVGSTIRHIATALVVIVEPESGRMRLASAGHPSPVMVGRAGAHDLIVPPGPPLGVEGAQYREVSAELDDEILVLFTDGLIERRGRHPDVGLDLLLRALERAPRGSPDEFMDGVISTLMADGTGSDDVVMLAAYRQPEARVDGSTGRAAQLVDESGALVITGTTTIDDDAVFGLVDGGRQ